MNKKPIENLVITSDHHCGSSYSICPAKDKIQVSDSDFMAPNEMQTELIEYWGKKGEKGSFWDWVDTKTGGTFDWCINGDQVDGAHHKSYARMTDQKTYQTQMAVDIIKPVPYRRLFMTYGTPAHDGIDGASIVGIANELKAEFTPGATHVRRNRVNHSRRFRFPNDALVDVKHHGRIAVPRNKPNLLYGEWVDCCVNRSLLHLPVPDMVVRSHGHEWKSCGVPAKLVRDVSIMLPGWQFLTPWAQAQPLSARNAVVNIGGVLLQIEDGRVVTHVKYWNVEQEEETIL